MKSTGMGIKPTEAGTASNVATASPVLVEFRDAIAEITLSNGPLNLVTQPFLVELNKVLARVREDGNLRCLILHGGESRAFCAGSDIKEFDDLHADASQRKILFEDMVLRNLARIPFPTIAAIDAPALGGGLELALACDLRVLRQGVKIGLPESQLGGLAGNGSVRLVRLIGPSRAKEMLFTGETLDASKALEWGVVNRITDGSALVCARELAETIARRGPLSNKLAKRLVEAAQDGPLDAALSASTVAQQRIFDSRDLYEGVEAFFTKRAPEFEGR
ncbi:enoyl-CoA hydratase/isomerase family protein [Mesorhizobium koreense]|uniref:enoyl-CoA hydratase/isomerase family protein n=1 Tax=Mesorhizobium koreense TaxID=3074855 RepID=UPI00287B9E3B|nr:enoyl-CoA hydratase/isomerase family protein [Mesorhizobium sp. WR6]